MAPEGRGGRGQADVWLPPVFREAGAGFLNRRPSGDLIRNLLELSLVLYDK